MRIFIRLKNWIKRIKDILKVMLFFLLNPVNQKVLSCCLVILCLMKKMNLIMISMERFIWFFHRWAGGGVNRFLSKLLSRRNSRKNWEVCMKLILIIFFGKIMSFILQLTMLYLFIRMESKLMKDYYLLWFQEKT